MKDKDRRIIKYYKQIIRGIFLLKTFRTPVFHNTLQETFKLLSTLVFSPNRLALQLMVNKQKRKKTSASKGMIVAAKGGKALRKMGRPYFPNLKYRTKVRITNTIECGISAYVKISTNSETVLLRQDDIKVRVLLPLIPLARNLQTKCSVIRANKLGQ